MPLDSETHRFFIALLPPTDVQDYANQVKQHFADRYHSKAAQKSPPHITLQPPFTWNTEARPVLEQRLSEFASYQSTVPVTLDGFAAFPPRVIFINVQKTPELLTLQQELTQFMQQTLNIEDARTGNRPFSPHLTVAFRDLTKPHFKAAWQEFQPQSVFFEFVVLHLTLLIHDGTRWNIDSQFPLLERFKPSDNPA